MCDRHTFVCVRGGREGGSESVCEITELPSKAEGQRK